MADAIAHYKILESLGPGGLGDVYRARDTRLGRTVAVKVLPPAVTSDPARLQALLDTTKALAGLSHANIAMLFESGQDGDQRFLVFEFVQGQPLASLINGRPLNVRRALEFAINLADALADAHALEMIHVDIRPETIMITPKDRAKFMNFGLSRFTTGGSARQRSATPYVSPEELAGKPGESQSDIYSLGAGSCSAPSTRPCLPSSSRLSGGCSLPMWRVERGALPPLAPSFAALRRYSIRARRR
jgi:serine/threonine protein kinase